MNLPQLIKAHNLVESDRVRILDPGVAVFQYRAGDVVSLVPCSLRNGTGLGIPDTGSDIPWEGDTMTVELVTEDEETDGGWRELESGELLPDNCEVRMIKGQPTQYRELPEELQPEQVVEVYRMDVHWDSTNGLRRLYGCKSAADEEGCFNAKIEIEVIDDKPDWDSLAVVEVS